MAEILMHFNLDTFFVEGEKIVIFELKPCIIKWMNLWRTNGFVTFFELCFIKGIRKPLNSGLCFKLFIHHEKVSHPFKNQAMSEPERVYLYLIMYSFVQVYHHQFWGRCILNEPNFLKSIFRTYFFRKSSKWSDFILEKQMRNISM